jgi:3-dehydroquinate synthase
MVDLLMFRNFRVKSSLRDYSVIFIEDFKQNIIREKSDKQYFIIDRKIYNLNKNFFDKNKIKQKSIIIKADENAKSFENFAKYANTLIKLKIDKNSEINLIGGGVIQDIGAFLSSILFRGVIYNFYPTTLLAQCDSCIGSKTSININSYKNLIGNFWPPKKVYIDFNFLFSLGISAKKSGIGEMCHYFLYSNIDLFNKFMGDYDKILINTQLIHKYIYKSLLIKKNVIQIDEFDNGERKKFNYGHTFGHAIEALTNYKINHGQAITMGMDFANYVSYNYNKLSIEKYELIRALLKKNFSKHNLKKYSLNKYISILKKDKKNKDSKLGCILFSENEKMHLTYQKFDKSFIQLVQNYFLLSK